MPNTPPNAPWCMCIYNPPVGPVTSTCVSQCQSSYGWIIKAMQLYTMYHQCSHTCSTWYCNTDHEKLDCLLLYFWKEEVLHHCEEIVEWLTTLMSKTIVVYAQLICTQIVVTWDIWCWIYEYNPNNSIYYYIIHEVWKLAEEVKLL